jgi:hypothetical protein
MKKFYAVLILSFSIFLLGCKSKAQQTAEEIIQLVTDYNLSVDTNHKLKICTKNMDTAYACDSKDAILVENLTLRYPGRIEGNFILQVTGGENHVGEFIGMGSADWLNVLSWAQGLETVDNEQDLRKFFNLNFMNFGFLQDDPNSADPGHFLDKNGNIFSESGQTSKDLEGIAARIEGAKTEKLGEILNINYGLSVDRAQSVARNISAYQKLSSRRSLTENEKNYFSHELLGVNYKDAQKALTSGDSNDLNALLEQAAEKNGTSPEQVSSIITEIFL